MNLVSLLAKRGGVRRLKMKIADQVYVGIDYVLTLDSGEEIDRSDPNQPLGFIYGAGQIIPGLEEKLEGMDEGESANLTIEAENGYGEYRDELKRNIPRANFPEDADLKPGAVFQGHGPHGPVSIRVLSADDKAVEADFNHPLAGERLHFDVKVVEVRPPTEEELEALNHSCSPSACAGCGSSGSCDGDH